MIKALLTLVTFASLTSLFAQSVFEFTDIAANNEQAHVRTVRVDVDGVRRQLNKAPAEFSQKSSKAIIELPLPDGSFLKYSAWNADQLPKHKNLGSYRVVNEYGSGRIAVSPYGISGVVQGPDGYFVIEAIDEETGIYQVAGYADFMEIVQQAEGALSCGYDDFDSPDFTGLELNEAGKKLGVVAGAVPGNAKAGNMEREMRQYDLIMTNTGEFAQSRTDGTYEGVLAAFNTAANTINAIFEPQVGVRMRLIEIEGLIYLDPNTDPYSNAANGSGLLGQVIEGFDANMVDPGSYDLGHIFTIGCDNGLGGIVSGAACTPGKTRGVTCVGGSVVGAALRIMAHEVAHQFTVSHSWNNCPSSQEQRASNTAFEPGSGTTLMSYAGACGSENIGGAQAYYHSGSLEQFLFFTREGGAAGCATIIETDNFTPDVDLNYEDDFFIPVSTPFRLEGSATDANDDEILFNWEQFDLGPASEVRNPRGNAPLFRSFAPSTTGNVRYFPNLINLVNDIRTLGETLPTYSRDMTFRLNAYDYNPEAGGADWEMVHFFTEEDAGPFVVNNPVNDTFNVGDYQEITWDVAGTNLMPVNCRKVNILLSKDGGRTFDEVLASDVPNTGSVFVTVPSGAVTDEARVMVEAADNIFLNVNSTDFVIEEADTPGFTLESTVRFQQLCLPDVLSTQFSSSSILGFDETITLAVEADSLPEGTSFEFSQVEIAPGESSNLQVNFNEAPFNGPISVTVLAITSSLDTARRQIFLDVVDNNFSDLVTLLPEEGTGGVGLGTTFDWTDATNAETYDIQIATSAAFNDEDIFKEASGLRESTFAPTNMFFDPNQLYFWRIRPTNACGDADWISTNSFRTQNVSCDKYEPSDLPQNLPNSGGLTRSSTIFVSDMGTINDLNVPNVRIRYNFVSNIRLNLVSPAGTSVILYDRRCLSTNTLNMGFDDNALSQVECPPDDARVFFPVGNLSDFEGEEIFGEWRLEVFIAEGGGSAGAIEAWNVEFCSATSALAPERISNNPTPVPSLRATAIIPANLEATSANYSAVDVNYTVTELPDNGRLLLYGRVLLLGDVFDQADINALGLKYEHTIGGTESDFFGFVVTTPDGGYLPITNHSIIIDEDAEVVSNKEVSELDAGLEVFPNPVATELTIRWAAPVNRALTLELFDLNGRRLRSTTVQGTAKAGSINTESLVAGVYLLRIDGAVRRIVKQ